MRVACVAIFLSLVPANLIAATGPKWALVELSPMRTEQEIAQEKATFSKLKCNPYPGLRFSEKMNFEGGSEGAVARYGIWLSSNFRKAYLVACQKGYFRKTQLTRSGGGVVLFGGKDVNVPSFVDGIEAYGARSIDIAFEFPSPNDKRLAPPSVPSILEAIYCRVIGATAKEQERTGRCLVD
jgi:hypothetical protein